MKTITYDDKKYSLVPIEPTDRMIEQAEIYECLPSDLTDETSEVSCIKLEDLDDE